MEFTSKKMKHAFFNEPKKILVCNHCVPFLDVLWFHFILNVAKITHFIYVGHCFGYENSWIRPIRSPHFIEKETRHLHSLDRCCSVIFPSGGKIKWKSGFFYLAKNTKIPLYIARLNYSNKKIEVLERISLADDNLPSFEDVKTHIITTLRTGRSPTLWWMYVLKWFGYGDESNF
jgi:hypothetical protein